MHHRDATRTSIRSAWPRFTPGFVMREAWYCTVTEPIRSTTPRAGSVPGQHGSIFVQTSERNPPPLFGAGLIDAIPDEVIEAAAKRKMSGSSAVKGRVSRLKDGGIGHFGWKAQTATLEDFVLSAAAGELGLEVPGRQQAADPRLPGVGAKGLDMDEADCKALVSYVRGLPVPVTIKPVDDRQSAQLKSGEEIFKSIGCTGCHMAKLGNVSGIYSDLLLHDMGPKLADAEAYAVFVNGPPKVDGRAARTIPTRAQPRRLSASGERRPSGVFVTPLLISMTAGPRALNRPSASMAARVRPPRGAMRISPPGGNRTSRCSSCPSPPHPLTVDQSERRKWTTARGDCGLGCSIWTYTRSRDSSSNFICGSR